MSGKNYKKNIKIAFVALGCPKNTIDSEKMLAQIVSSGLILTDSLDNSDVVVINTCGFIDSARREAFGEIENAVSLKKLGKIKKIVVAGCMAQLYGEKMLEMAPDIDAVVGLSARDEIAKIIKSLFRQPTKQLHLEGDNRQIHYDSDRLLLTGGHYAYLRISEGCSRKCAFCTIPDIRGPFRSKPMEMILDEAIQLAQSGVKELILIAQDTSNYGRDLNIKDGLVKLLEQLEKISQISWIRVMYLYPANITEALIEKISASSKMLHYIDMPIQHINDDILRAMRRSDSCKNTTEVILALRKSIPDIVLRTTVITGFPGETEKQFNQLLEYIKQTKFDMLGCFAYSAEDNTVAAQMQNQIPDDVKQRRFETIMQVQQNIAFEKARNQIGKNLKVIVDNTGESGFASGRYYGQAPDIDSICLIENFKSSQGDIIDVQVKDADGYDLIVDQI